jgi:hypothetical protein
MLVARSYGDPGRFEEICERLLTGLGISSRGESRAKKESRRSRKAGSPLA